MNDQKKIIKVKNERKKGKNTKKRKIDECPQKVKDCQNCNIEDCPEEKI